MTAEWKRANCIGQCACPICKDTDAEVCEGKSGKFPYVICESCGTMIQTRTRKGARLLLALGGLNQVPEPAPLKPPPLPPAPQPGRVDPIFGRISDV